MTEHTQRASTHAGHRPYAMLAIELAIHFVVMYLVMFTMIATLDHFYNNLNMAYMTLMMVAPMTLVMLGAMRSMFPSRRTNIAIAIAAVAVFGVSFYAVRTQALVGNKAFLESMIPHHSGAILMCERAKIADPEVVALCDEIVESQRREISQMQAILKRL